MKKLLLLLTVSVLLTSCYTLNTAQRQVSKAHFKFPKVTSDLCATAFPIKDSIVEKIKVVPGEIIIKTDTTVVDCDSIVKDPNIKNKVIVKYKNIYKTDTIVKTKTIVKENTAKITNLELQIKDKDKEIALRDDEIENKSDSIALLRKFLLGAILGIVALFLLKR